MKIKIEVSQIYWQMNIPGQPHISKDSKASDQVIFSLSSNIKGMEGTMHGKWSTRPQEAFSQSFCFLPVVALGRGDNFPVDLDIVEAGAAGEDTAAPSGLLGLLRSALWPWFKI